MRSKQPAKVTQWQSKLCQTTIREAEVVLESPFYIPMTEPAARSRRSLKHDDTSIFLLKQELQARTRGANRVRKINVVPPLAITPSSVAVLPQGQAGPAQIMEVKSGLYSISIEMRDRKRGYATGVIVLCDGRILCGDLETFAFIYNPQQRPGLSSFDLPAMKKNADGSTTSTSGRKRLRDWKATGSRLPASGHSLPSAYTGARRSSGTSLGKCRTRNW
jgi:hypothetical protein